MIDAVAASLDWAESALMENDFDPAHLTIIRNAIARIGAADVRTFGLTWEHCEQLLSELGYSDKVSIIAR